jgi:hypothetical protein
MTPIAGHHQVVVLPSRKRANDGRFGAVGQVRVSADHARVLYECALNALLELADSHHLGVHPDEPIFPEGLHGVWHE